MLSPALVFSLAGRFEKEGKNAAATSAREMSLNQDESGRD